MFGLHASAGVVGSVASALVAPSAYCAAVVESVATAVFVGDDVVGFGAVGLHAVVVVELGVADWAVGDASGLFGLEDSFAPASVFAGCGAAGLAGHVLILAWFVCCGLVGCPAWWVCCGVVQVLFVRFVLTSIPFREHPLGKGFNFNFFITFIKGGLKGGVLGTAYL